MQQQHNTGLTSELRAAHLFAANGGDVFWPLLTQSRCDFVVGQGGNLQKVQVKTATWSKAGPHYYLQCRLKSRNKHTEVYKEGDFDLIVFVDGDRLWVAPWEDVKELVSVCLDCSNPEYNPRNKTYDPDEWRIN